MADQLPKIKRVVKIWGAEAELLGSTNDFSFYETRSEDEAKVFLVDKNDVILGEIGIHFPNLTVGFCKYTSVPIHKYP